MPFASGAEVLVHRTEATRVANTMIEAAMNIPPLSHSRTRRHETHPVRRRFLTLTL